MTLSRKKNYKRKKPLSRGDYMERDDARTFEEEFYYINFIDRIGEFDSDYSEKIENKKYAMNRARWIVNNKWVLYEIPYRVESVGVYSSLKGHIKSFDV